LQGLPQRGLGSIQGHGIGRHPARAPAEERNIVYGNGECSVIPVDLDGPEPDGTQIHVDSVNGETHRIERLGAMGMGPPQLGVRDRDHRFNDRVAACFDSGGRLAHLSNSEHGLATCIDSLDEQSNADGSVRPVAARVDVSLGYERRSARMMQPDGTPRSYGCAARRPTRDAAEECGAIPALILRAKEQASPSTARFALGQQRCQSSESHHQRVLRSEPVDPDPVGDPHVL